MNLSVIALSLLLAHWVNWEPSLVQMGVSIGVHSDEHLILMVTSSGCSKGMKIYSGQEGDLERALTFMKHSKMCQIIDQRIITRETAVATPQTVIDAMNQIQGPAPNSSLPPTPEAGPITGAKATDQTPAWKNFSVNPKNMLSKGGMTNAQ